MFRQHASNACGKLTRDVRSDADPSALTTHPHKPETLWHGGAKLSPQAFQFTPWHPYHWRAPLTRRRTKALVQVPSSGRSQALQLGAHQLIQDRSTDTRFAPPRLNEHQDRPLIGEPHAPTSPCTVRRGCEDLHSPRRHALLKGMANGVKRLGQGSGGVGEHDTRAGGVDAKRRDMDDAELAS